MTRRIRKPDLPPVFRMHLMDKNFFWKENGQLRLLVSKQLQDAGFENGFSTRLGGVSPFPENDLNLAGFSEDTEDNIQENRRRFLTFFPDGFEMTSVWQVHGTGIKTVNTRADAAETEDRADALVTDLPDLLLGVKTADCVPILIGDPVTGALASVHAGWRGTLGRIAEKVVGTLADRFGSDPADLICAIGPAATACCYEVGPEVVSAFENEFSTGGRLFVPTAGGHALVDLHLANREQLTNASLRPENISSAPYCTMERTDLFFSYRKEKALHGRTGRLMSVIGRTA